MDEINTVLDQLETPIQPNAHLKSAIYQPKRISLNSQDDVTAPYAATQFDTSVFQYNSFRITLSRPVLYAKSVQLLRATIPTPFPTIPDGECVFWYYRIKDDVDPVAQNFTLDRLCYVRLVPSFVGYVEDDAGKNYGYNRTFNSYADVVTELRLAAANDPGTNDNTTYPRYFPNDVTFGFDERTNKFYMLGTDTGYRYIPASYNDANLRDPTMLNNFELATRIEYTNDEDPPPKLYYDQPVTPYRPLELRLGWTYSGYSPIVYYNAIASPFANVTSYANGYADLVNTQDLYVYLDFILGGTLDSAGNGNLLSVIPLATTNLGVAFYNNVVNNPITQLPETISEILVRLITDTGVPFNLPNNAIVNLEIGFTY